MRIVNWNIERKAPHSWQAQSLVSEIRYLAPDLICLTEAYETSLSDMGGETISVTGVKWSKQADSERKVLLWSRTPWTDIEQHDLLNQTGAAVSGITSLGGRYVRVLGMCTPYHMASPVGVEPRAKPWSQHELFLDGLKPLLNEWKAGSLPVIVLGDFNQFHPRIWGAKSAHQKLVDALGGMEVVTSGLHPGFEKHAIDHVVLSSGMVATSVSGRSRFDARGKPRSDHFGVLVDLDFLQT